MNLHILFMLGSSLVALMLCFLHGNSILGKDPGSNAASDRTLPVIMDQSLLTHLANAFEPHNRILKVEEGKVVDGLELSWHMAIATLLSGMAAMVSAVGGIGGGALYVPIFNLILQFDTKMAAVFSNFVIFSGMVGTVSWYIFQKNPYAMHDQPLIDYDTVLIIQPNMLLGISIGVFCNVMFPSWFITTLLVITLSYMIMRSCRSGFQRWRQESYQRSRRKHALPVNENDDLRASIVTSEEDGQQNSEIHEPLLAPQPSLHRQFPPYKIFALFIIWVSFLSLQFLRGEFGKRAFNLEECGTGYWWITSMQLPLALIISTSVLYALHRNPTASLAALSSKALRLLPITALLAGILGSTLGIGGGLIINPLLHEMGMPPQVTAATCAFTIFFSSFMSVVQFWLLGHSPLDYAIYFSLVSLAFSVIGVRFLQRAIVRSGRLSLIIFAVTIVMAISATFMAFFGTLDAWRDFQQGKNMGLSPPC